MEAMIFEALARHGELVLSLMRPRGKEILIELADKITSTFENGGKLMWCGNGGSAADAAHCSAEYSVRFQANRKPLPSIVLAPEATILTATGNDFGFTQVFARQVLALGKPEDLLITMSTSGLSESVLEAVTTFNSFIATLNSFPVVSFVGNGFFPDVEAYQKDNIYYVCVPSTNTARVQEIFMLMNHVVCELVDERYKVKP